MPLHTAAGDTGGKGRVEKWLLRANAAKQRAAAAAGFAEALPGGSAEPSPCATRSSPPQLARQMFAVMATANKPICEQQLNAAQPLPGHKEPASSGGEIQPLEKLLPS